MKAININEEDFEFLTELQNNLKTQDVRGTSDPLYCVQKLVLIPTDEEYGYDVGYFVEMLTGDYNKYETIFGAYRDLLESGYSKNEIRNSVLYVCFKESWETIQTCLTEYGAETFKKRKKHDYTDLRIYVTSGYHNYEMIRLRNFLMNLTLN